MRARIMVVGFLAAATVFAMAATALAIEVQEVSEPGDALQCYTIDGQAYCLGVGFVAYQPGTPEWETWNQGVLGDTRSTPGDESTVESLRRRAAMPERERRVIEQQEIQAAIGAVGRIKLVDLLADGLPIPEGFFARYPSLGIAEGSPMAEAMRVAAPRAREVGLLQALWEANPAVVAGLPTDPEHDETLWTGDGPPPYPGESSEPIAGITDARLNSPRSAVGSTAVGVESAGPIEGPWSRYIIYSAYREQVRADFCGPATFQSIDGGDDGGFESQYYWAPKVGSYDSSGGYGASISKMVQAVNQYTNWDSSAHGGPYAVVDVSGYNQIWFQLEHEIRIGVYGAPIIEHVRLLRQYFSYLRYDHGGHFQTGRGYSYTTEKFGIFEPYDERDWTSGGYYTGKRQYVPFKNLWDATRTHWAHNIGA